MFVFCCLVLDRSFANQCKNSSQTRETMTVKASCSNGNGAKKICGAPLDQSARTKVSVPHDDVEKEKSF